MTFLEELVEVSASLNSPIPENSLKQEFSLYVEIIYRDPKLRWLFSVKVDQPPEDYLVRLSRGVYIITLPKLEDDSKIVEFLHGKDLAKAIVYFMVGCKEAELQISSGTYNKFLLLLNTRRLK